MKKFKISDIPSVDRPREKLKAKGAQNLKNAELLAILLGSGYQGKNVIELAKSILSKYPRKKFLNLTYNELVQIKGISQAKACKILSAVELTKRALNVGDETAPIIKTPKDIVAQAVYMRDKTREHLMVIYLNARNEMIFKKPMFVGTLNANLVHPREIFQYALKKNAAAIVLVHNHPSGDPEPSQDDLTTTKRIVEAGKIMGIEVIDHIIIAKTKIFSFKEKELL
ncbi:MAG: DNA repair protein RadC [Patescibacteria group bacterium]|nr:DNA repair protein RadC [Patescibacteria group bacterium]